MNMLRRKTPSIKERHSQWKGAQKTHADFKALGKKTYADREPQTLTAQQRVSKLEAKQGNLTVKGTRIDAQLATARTFIGRNLGRIRQNRLIKRKEKIGKKLTHAKARQTTTRANFESRFDAQVATRAMAEKHALAQFRQVLAQLALNRRPLAAEALKTLRTVKAINSSLPAARHVAVTKFDDLANKIRAESAAASDPMDCAYRLVVIENDLQSIASQLRRHDITTARHEMDRLIALAEKAPEYSDKKS